MVVSSMWNNFSIPCCAILTFTCLPRRIFMLIESKSLFRSWKEINLWIGWSLWANWKVLLQSNLACSNLHFSWYFTILSEISEDITIVKTTTKRLMSPHRCLCEFFMWTLPSSIETRRLLVCYEIVNSFPWKDRRCFKWKWSPLIPWVEWRRKRMWKTFEKATRSFSINGFAFLNFWFVMASTAEVSGQLNGLVKCFVKASSPTFK